MRKKAFGGACAAGLGLFVLFCPVAAHASDNSSWLGRESWKARPSLSLQTLFGPRVSWTSMSTHGSDSLGGGVTFNSAGYITIGAFTLRGVGITSFGSGSEGVEGHWAGDFSFGVKAPIAPEHGPFLRVGMRGYLLGNERVWLSNFEAPTGTAGYQYIDGPWLFEAAGRVGMVAVGRHSLWTGDDLTDLNRRRLGQPSAAWGGHLAFGYGVFRGEVEHTHIAVADAIGTPLDVWRVSACLRFSSVGGCLDHQSWVGDARLRDGTTPQLAVSYGGISIGLWTP